MLRRQTFHLLMGACWSGASCAELAAGMVASTKGSLPLLLTAPHDGIEALGKVPPRIHGVLQRDTGTSTLAKRVADQLENRLGKRPYLVLAKFSRRYLDVNRPPELAMESPEALPAYKAYHTQIARVVMTLRKDFPAGALLLDIHGQSGAPNTTFRGTKAGLTTTNLLKRFGAASIQGANSITGVLQAKGFSVHPTPEAETLHEDKRYSGGYTVQTYGSHHPAGIDAIQLEFGKNNRENPRLPDAVTEALIVFMQQHGML